jgi:membrane associated rhomboid family serine protease
MGIYDRDYYRERSGFSAFDGRVQACYVLAGIYVCVFLIQLATRDAAFGVRPRFADPVAQLLELKASKVLDGEVWRVITYSFIHDPNSVLPLVVNVLFLVWFGRSVEEMYGWKEFLAYYFLASLLAGLGFVLVVAAGQKDGVLTGPAGSITAVLFLYALHFPRRTILLFFVLPCPVWLVVAFYVFTDVAGFLDGRLHPAAFAAHAVAAGFHAHHQLAPGFARPPWPGENSAETAHLPR